MKKFKKKALLVLTILVVIVGIVFASILIQYSSEKKEDKRREYIQSLIDLELDANNQNEEKPSASGSLSDIISGSITESTVTPVFSNIEMINASTFKATINGQTKTYRLIGLQDSGDVHEIKKMLQSLTSIVITHDSMIYKKGSDIELIYLWNNDDKNLNNMINLQIVKNGWCDTTYLGTSYAEHPNIKYVTQFVAAAKGK